MGRRFEDAKCFFQQHVILRSHEVSIVKLKYEYDKIKMRNGKQKRHVEDECNKSNKRN